MKLSEEQRNFSDWFLNHKSPICVLTGHAGSGKTTVMGELDKKIKAVWCAPSHQAKNVLGRHVVNGEVKTIDAALGLRPVKNYGGGGGTKFLPRGNSVLNSAKIAIFDEASMINDEKLGWITEKGISKILFVGDPCFAGETEILMYDGTTKMIKNVGVGQLVMGPDSKPRKTLRVFNGVSQLYTIDQYHGMNYTVTENHKIAYRRRRNRLTEGFRDDLSEDNNSRGLHRHRQAINVSDKYRYPSYGDYPLITAKDAANLSNKFSDEFGGYNVPINFPEKKLQIDPYYLGQWLGDGDRSAMRISTADVEVVDFCKKYAAKFASLSCNSKWYSDKHYFRVSISRGNKNGSAKNELLERFRKYGLISQTGGNPKSYLKHIPNDFLINSTENRLNLLAGLIDSDGSYDKLGSRYSFSNSDMKLINDVERLVVSLGFRCKSNHYNEGTCIFNNKKYNAKATTNLYITGDIHNIPCLIKRKIASTTKRSVATTRINVDKTYFGEYFGIEVDDDHLFLLKDCTVVSNCQLPPVMSLKSPVFEKDYPTYHLSKVFRQAEGSPILDFATDIRETGGKNPDKYGIKQVGLNLENVMEFYRRYPEGVAVCPTHNEKEFVNKAARKVFDIEDSDKPFLKGERLLLESPIEPPRGPQNGDMVTISSNPKDVYFQGFRVWEMQVATNLGAVYDIRAPNDESERKAIEKQIRKLSKEYRACGSEQRKEHLAREMDLLTEGITQAGAGYGVTIHKAQGSTYEDVLFLTGGMRFFRTDAEKKKMAYTAVTRAAKNLILCEGIL